jgi:hypothetical protein
MLSIVKSSPSSSAGGGAANNASAADDANVTAVSFQRLWSLREEDESLPEDAPLLRHQSSTNNRSESMKSIEATPMPEEWKKVHEQEKAAGMAMVRARRDRARELLANQKATKQERLKQLADDNEAFTREEVKRWNVQREEHLSMIAVQRMSNTKSCPSCTSHNTFVAKDCSVCGATLPDYSDLSTEAFSARDLPMAPDSTGRLFWPCGVCSARNSLLAAGDVAEGVAARVGSAFLASLAGEKTCHMCHTAKTGVVRLASADAKSNARSRPSSRANREIEQQEDVVSTGGQLRLCKGCGKIVERQQECDICVMHERLV